MKKQLTVALGLAVLATPAFATKARLQALGEDAYGSFYVNDNRNIWFNAAQINNHKDLVTYEFGTTSGVTSKGQDSAKTPRGEGGVTKSFGNMTYGLHFGGASNTSNGLRTASGVTDSYEENNVDVFVGGDAGLKWGANLGYSKSQKDESTTNGAKQEALRTRLGVIMGDTQGYANFNIANTASGGASANKFNGKLGYQVGAIHAWEGNSLFVDWRSFEGDAKIASTGAKNDLKLTQLQVGIGRVTRLNDKTNLFTKAQYILGGASNEGGSATFVAGTCDQNNVTGCRRYSTGRLPVTVGLETDATSWLTFRASVGQVVYGDEANKGKSRSVKNSSIVNAGASLKFGEFTVDGVIGNNDGSTIQTEDATQAAGTGTNSGTLRTDNLMTRVAMTYRF